MAITKQTRPYEFLARWDHETGAFKGAHIQHYESLVEDGVMLSGKPGRAMGVGEDLAFPLADIMGQLTADALAANAALQATLTERDATIAGHADVIQQRDAAQARVAELEAQIAAMQQVAVSVVPMSAARIALSRVGKLQAVQAAIQSIQGQPGEEARQWWEYSSEIRRAHPLVAALTPLIGTSEDVDALFALARQIADAIQT